MKTKNLVGLATVLTLSLGLVGQVFAQPAPTPNWTIPAAPAFQAAPTSPVNATSLRFGTTVDDFIGVTDWNGVAGQFERNYFFLGGDGAVASSGIQAGYARKFGESNYLAFYYNGVFFNGDGSTKNINDPKSTTTIGQSTWNNQFAVLFGNDKLGGLRLDLLSPNSPANDTNTSNSSVTDDDSEVKHGGLITTLQWGKAGEKVTPRIMVGFKWPDSETHTKPVKTSQYSDAALTILPSIDIGDFTIEDQFTVNFGTSTTTDGKTDSTTGWVLNNLTAKYHFTFDIIEEKLQFKVRPRLQIALAGKDNKSTPADGDPTYGAPDFWFSLAPDVQLGVKLQATERLALYTGVDLEILKWDIYAIGKYKTGGANSQDVKDTYSWWQVSGISFGNVLNFAGTFAFNEIVSLEASLSSDLLSVGTPGSDNGNFAVKNPFGAGSGVNNIVNAGSLALVIKK